MPKDFTPVFSELIKLVRPLPTFHSSLIFTYAKNVFDKTRKSSHISFLRSCLRHRVVPVGMSLKHKPSDKSNIFVCAKSAKLLQCTSFSLMKLHVSSLDREVKHISKKIEHGKRHLSSIFGISVATLFKHKVHDLNIKVHRIALSKKQNKLNDLVSKSD